MVDVSAITPMSTVKHINITVEQAEPGCMSAMFKGCIMSAIRIETGPK